MKRWWYNLQPNLPYELGMNCLLCQSDQQKIFARAESFSFPLVYYQCKTCGLVFQLAEESQASDPEFYMETYRQIYQSSETPTPKDIWVQEQRAFHLIDLIKSEGVTSLKRVLDIGASTGILLQEFQQAFDSDVVGVEPGDAYRAYASQHGLRMYSSLEALIGSSSEKFDLVSMLHVLEHLPDPLDMLKTIKENLLIKEGLLLIEVPNFYGHDSYELAHMACYSPHTLCEVIRKAGFEVHLLKKHGFPRSNLINLYLTALAKPSNEAAQLPTLTKESFVPLKRTISMSYRRVVQKLFPKQAWLPLPRINGD